MGPSGPNYDMPDDLRYTTAIPSLQDTDPASASEIFNPWIMPMLVNIHALKLLSNALTGVDVFGVVPTFSDLPPAIGMPVGTIFLILADETRPGSPSALYEAIGGAWVYKQDYSVYGAMQGLTIATEDGLFGLRFWEGKLQVKDGDDWIDVGGGVPHGSFSVSPGGVLSSSANFGATAPNTSGNVLVINDGFATVNGETAVLI